jgi:acetyl/propionyl-CoA carboxylase alpha subunit
MNTRLQVEHPVTEMITGIDIVKEQIRIAEGKPLSFSQDDIKIFGHAIECRIYAEDIDNNFAPSTGENNLHRLTSGPGIRIDRGIDVMSDVPIYYDPMLSKVIAWGKNREEAIVRMKRALSEYQICGVTTNISLFKWILNQNEFEDGTFDINFLENKFLPLVPNKWRNSDSEELINVVAAIAAIMKNESQDFLSSKNSLGKSSWRDQIYE